MAVERPPGRRFGKPARPSGGRRTGVLPGPRRLVALGRPHLSEYSDPAVDRIREVLRTGGPQMLFQPQLSLIGLRVEGYEALARFPGDDGDDGLPGAWFALARQAGLGAELEAQALRNAFVAAAHRPAGCRVAVNVSPGVLDHPAVLAALPDDLTGYEIELTEHAAGLEAGPLRDRLEPLRERGALLAIDDVGTAYSGLRRVVELSPDTLKLDRNLVTGVSRTDAKAAMIGAVVDYAEHIQATVCAEGVEDLGDLARLGDLGVGIAQGWAIGPPAAHFTPARPEALAAGGLWLDRTLHGRLIEPDRHTSAQDRLEHRMLGTLPGPASVEELVCRLARCGDAVELHDRVHQLAELLGCDRSALCLTAPGGPREVELGPVGRLVVPVDEAGRMALTCERWDGRPWSGRQIRTARLVASVVGAVVSRLEPVRRPVALH
jgi:EAL domain-containing protein (putative c-di-GMP-specific phosphodiesterase class I)